jgi:hypothetical protein
MLTTEKFRKGENPQAWGAGIQTTLQQLRYHHLGGPPVQASIGESVAIPTIEARIATLLGVSTQTETYIVERVAGR